MNSEGIPSWTVGNLDDVGILDILLINFVYSSIKIFLWFSDFPGYVKYQQFNLGYQKVLS